MKQIRKIFLLTIFSLALVPKAVFAESGWSVSSASEFGLPSGTIISIVNAVLAWLLGAIGLFAIIGFLISGALYLTSAGNEDQMKQAKRAMNYSIIGVIVSLAGYVVIQAIDAALGGSSTF